MATIFNTIILAVQVVELECGLFLGGSLGMIFWRNKIKLIEVEI